MATATAPVQEAVGVMQIMGRPGDTRVTWSRTNQHEIDAAKTQFMDLTEQGFAAFSVLDNGDQGERITEFNPAAERIILVPPMAGG